MNKDFIATLRFDDRGLIPVIAQQHDSGEVLMQAFMNAQAIEETLSSRRVTYWSRSRQSLWKKGETSGHIQNLVDFRVDCDRDSILVLVDQIGPACHTNRRSCYYTALRGQDEIELMRPETE